MHRFPQKSHHSKPLLPVGSFIHRLFPSKRHESWTHVILLLSFGLGFDNKETAETHSD
jgi:hypothetical protein